MISKKKFVLLIFSTLLCAFIIAFRLPVKMLANSLITTDLMSKSIMADIRQSLTRQEAFHQLLAKHKGKTKRYLYRTDMMAYTSFDFGLYDIYATYINADKD